MNAAFSMTLVLLASPAPAVAQGDWTALPLPGSTEAHSQKTAPSIVAEGRHIYMSERDADAGETLMPLVPAETVTLLLEARAREAGQELALLPGMPPLLASGSSAALEAARVTLSELEAESEALAFDLQVCISALGVAKAGMSDSCEGPHVFANHSGRFRPGELIEFGERETRPFLAGYRVDVAADSGVAAPIVGEVVTGQLIRLSAHRVSGGSKFFVQGVLDFSELAGLELFETDAPDLGSVQQPLVDSCQLAFSALASSGVPIVIELENTPLKNAHFKVVLRFDNRSASESTLDLVDLSFLAQASPRLPLFELGSDRFFRGVASESTFAAIPTRALTSLASERRGNAGLYASSRALLIDEGHAESAAKIRQLIAGYEGGRLSTGQIEVRHGALLARLPSTSFAPTRLVVGRERTELVGYRAEIAPEIWMPVPNVQRLFNGLVLDARQTASELHAAAVSVRSGDAQVVSRFESNLGRIQLRPRAQIESQRVLKPSAEKQVLWRESEDVTELSVIFSKS